MQKKDCFEILVWLKLSLHSAGGFIWTDNSPVEYSNWAEGEPSDDGTEGENCVEMYTTDGTWNDISCVSQNGYICKVPKGVCKICIILI